MSSTSDPRPARARRAHHGRAHLRRGRARRAPGRNRAVATVALLCTALAGCADDGTATGGTSVDELQGEWQLSSGSGPDGSIPTTSDEHHPTLTIDGDDWSGSVCNQYGASATVADDQVTLDAVHQTEMACEEDGVMEAEAAYLDAFRQVTEVDRVGRHLVLRGEDVELVYAPLDTTDDAELTGTRWQLVSLVDDQGPDGAVSDAPAPAELQLRDDGRLAATTGCQELSGPYHLDGPLLDLTEVRADDTPCVDPAITEQDEHVRSVLLSGTGITTAIEGDVLELTAPGGRGLHYREG